MKTIVSALIALSVLAGIAAPASALDARASTSSRTARPTDAGNRIAAALAAAIRSSPEKEGSHETLTNVAVYGLVPVPPSADTRACSDNDNQSPRGRRRERRAACVAST